MIRSQYFDREDVMTKVRIEAGICGHVTTVAAESEDGMDVTLKVETDCAAIRKLFDELGDGFDAYELCFSKPGGGILYEVASTDLEVSHGACPVIAGAIKAVEAECHLALPKNASITFVE